MEAIVYREKIIKLNLLTQVSAGIKNNEKKSGKNR